MRSRHSLALQLVSGPMARMPERLGQFLSPFSPTSERFTQRAFCSIGLAIDRFDSSLWLYLPPQRPWPGTKSCLLLGASRCPPRLGSTRLRELAPSLSG